MSRAQIRGWVRGIITPLVHEAAESGVRSTVHEATESGARHAVHEATESVARHATQDAVHSGTHEVTHVAASDLRAAAKSTTHIVSDAGEVARAKGPKWKSTLAKFGPGYIKAAGVVGIGGYAAYNANKRLGQLGTGAVDVANEVRHSFENAFNHLPNPSDIEQIASKALHGAHSTLEGLAGPASTGLTIVVILGSAVIAYEGYRSIR